MKAIQIFNAKVAILLFVIIGTLTWIVYENWSSTSNDIGPSINLNQNVSANGGSRINELPVIKATAQTPLVQATNDLQIIHLCRGTRACAFMRVHHWSCPVVNL